MNRRTLAGLSKKLLEEEEHDQEEKEQEKQEQEERETSETAEQKENPHPDPEDQDEEEETEEDLIEYLQRRKRRKKQEETHTRKTFLVENDMLTWMKRQAKKYGFGFYTDFINMSLKLGKEQLEEAEKAKKK